jgi:tetratricopeptide (TPR) repeat protein
LRGASPSSTLVSIARESALRAIELDPEMIESYSCLGSAQALEWDWESAEKSFLHGQGLGFQVSASRQYGIFLAALGRYDEASHHLEAAQRIDPFSNRQKVARAKFLQIRGRFEEGLRQLSEPLMYGPLPVEARFLIALMAAQLGKKEPAMELIEGIRSDYGAELPMMAGIAEVLAMTGDKEEAKRIARGLKLLSMDAPISRFRQALLAMAMEDSEGALSFLKLAVEEREAELVWIGVDPRLDGLRNTPGFQALVHKVVPALES